MFHNPHLSEHSRGLFDASCFQRLMIRLCDALSGRFANDFHGFRCSTRAVASVFPTDPFGTPGLAGAAADLGIPYRELTKRRLVFTNAVGSIWTNYRLSSNIARQFGKWTICRLFGHVDYVWLGDHSAGTPLWFPTTPFREHDWLISRLPRLAASRLVLSTSFRARGRQ
jgi:hypothetical protein